MKRIRRIWSVLFGSAIMLLCLSGIALAAEQGAAGRYDATACRRGDDTYTCDGEYLLLNEDGSGEIRFNDAVYSMEWKLDGTSLSFTDVDGESGSGILENGRIEAEYLDYEYVYEKTGDSVKEEAAGQDTQTQGADAAESSGPDTDAEVNSGVAQAQDPVDLSAIKTGSGPVVYDVESREDSGSSSGLYEDASVWKLDYIAMNDDGSGVFMFNQAAFTIRWKLEGKNYTFTDHRGNEFTGTVDGNRITGVYGRYRYTFVQSDLELPVYGIAPERWAKGLAPITDQAGVLPDSLEAEYAEKAQQLADQYDVGVYVVLLDSRDQYTWTKNIEALGEEIRAGYQLGIGPTEKKEKHEGENVNPDWKDSIVLTVAFDCRKYDICVSGAYADWAFPQYGREKKIRDAFVDDFQENEWAGGIRDFLNGVEQVLKVASKGHAISFKYDTPGRLIGIFVPILLAILFGYGVAALMRASMKDTQEAQNASAYVTGNRVNFTRREDRYIRTLVSRTYSPREKSSGGGGGGHSSSGSSHTSGSF